MFKKLLSSSSKKQFYISVVALVLTVIAVIAMVVVKTNNSKVITADIIRSKEYETVESEDEGFDNCEFVKFTAFFTKDLNGDGIAEKLLGSCTDLNATDALYMDINVLSQGSLKDGQILIEGNNFNLKMAMIKDDVLKYNYISDNVTKIELKDISAGTQKLVFGRIIPDIQNNINNYSKVNSITFKGTYVPEEGESINLEKKIDLTVDWYGEVSTQINKLPEYEANCEDIQNDTIVFTFDANEVARKLILKDNVSKIIIPELCGYAPTEVKSLGENDVYEYNSDTRELIITRSSLINDDGTVSTALGRYNQYAVAITYPPEAYKMITSYEVINIDIETYYTGYNNPNDEFENPYQSNVAVTTIPYLIRMKPAGSAYMFYVDYIDKQYIYYPYYKYIISIQDVLSMYEGLKDPKDKEFTVRWTAERGPQGEVTSMIMKETHNEENYGDKWDNTSMEEYFTNTGIYFSGADQMLGEDGFITVYNDETNELIHIFRKNEWNIYTASNPYKYDYAVRHIRVETSTTAINTKLYVFNKKALDINKLMQDFDENTVRDMTATYTYLTGECKANEQVVGTMNTADIAYFIHEKSMAQIDLKTNTAIVYEEMQNQEIYITTMKNVRDEADWKDGQFLVEVPSEIINMNINSITADKTSVEIKSYDLYQDENGKYYIRILTKNDVPDTYKITINCNLTVDPRVPTVKRDFILYSHNDAAPEYINYKRDIYDVNGNNDKNEMVGYAQTSIDILAPTSIITMETVTNYDSNIDDEITIAPNVALVERDERKATINVQLTNNYPNTVSGVAILGKIPYKNNTYIINGKPLKSEFTTTITDEGIKPANNMNDSIKQKTVVHYSEKETPTKDLENNENGWMTSNEVIDWSKIKSYLIEIRDNRIQSGEEIAFNYDVTLPNGIDLNDEAFSTHAIYFALDTEGGMINLSTEPTKVGVKIVARYDLDLTKYKFNSDLKIPGVTYELSYSERNAELELESKKRLITTDERGNILLKNLYANIEYTLKEIKVPDTCEINEEVIRFIVNENGELTINGVTKNANFANEILKIDLEDEVKLFLQVHKTKIGTDINIDNVVFEVSDEEGNKQKVKTKSGIANIKGLSIGKTYTLIEKSVPSTVLKKDGIYKFRTYRDENNNVKLETIENTLLKDEAAIEDSETALNPIVKTNVENELRYSLNILKKNNHAETMSGVVFELVGENSRATITTNSDGKYSLAGLKLGETYKLKELRASGCFLNQENDNSITFKVERNTSNGNIELTEMTESGDTKLLGNPELTEEGVKVQLSMTMENEKIPTYKLKLIKKNEYGELLTGARFELKRLSDNKVFEATTNENSEVEFNDLYENIPERGASYEYELKEVFAPEGYRIDNTVLRFTAKRNDNGILEFNGIDGLNMIKDTVEKDYKELETDENTITMSIVNKPIFDLIKYDEGENLLPNAKFVITDLEGNLVRNSKGNILGELQSVYGIEGDIEFGVDDESKWHFEDGVWKSGDRGSRESSVLESKPFVIIEDQTISVDCAITTSYYNAYVQILDEDNNVIQSNSFYGSSSASNEDNIKFTNLSFDLKKGTYKIRIVPPTNPYISSSLDLIYIKNISKYGLKDIEVFI